MGINIGIYIFIDKEVIWDQITKDTFIYIKNKYIF